MPGRDLFLCVLIIVILKSQVWWDFFQNWSSQMFYFWLEITFIIWMFPKIVGFPPKSSFLIGFSIINHPFWGTTIFGNTYIAAHTQYSILQFFIPHHRSVSSISTSQKVLRSRHQQELPWLWPCLKPPPEQMWAKKKLVFFHCTGCLLRILRMVHYNPHIVV